MKTTRPGRVRFPRMYQAFENAQEIANVINRSTSYVHKALKEGFTAHEWEMLAEYANRTDLSSERKILHGTVSDL